MAFWIIALGFAALVAATLVRALWQDAGAGSSGDVAIYRDQLREVDRDVARGVLGDEEAEAARIEVSRRLLAADKAVASAAASGGPERGRVIAAAAVAAISFGGAIALYMVIGAPGYPDLPLDRRIALADAARADRPGQAEAERAIPESLRPDAQPEHLTLVTRLREALEDRPDDLQGHRLLAQHEANLGRFQAAAAAQTRVIGILGENATAEDHARLADVLILAAGGYVSPEAEAAIGATLSRDPGNGTALYYAGLLEAQTGRPDRAFRIWRRLLEGTSDQAPWALPIRAQIEQVAALAGVDYVLPELGRGPTADDVAAAEQMSPTERMAMIEGMVASLSSRLAEDGGPPEDWARLIRALGVLGQREDAAAIWTEAQQVFPDPVTRLPILDAARDAGVAQ
ncbi:MAG: c-type cytochrome biogenesis protein CcmI [Pseudomonadota bacterium]